MSLATENPHQTLLEQRLPSWATAIATEQWQALRSSLPATAAEVGAPQQARLDQARRALAVALGGLRQPAEFAEPLLVERFATLSMAPRATELIRIHPFFTHGVYVYSHERHTLLDAALQNFADGLTFSSQSSIALSQHIEVTPQTVVGQTTLGDSETLVDINLASHTYAIEPLPLAPAAFAEAVRDLDLGLRYQVHLDEVFARPPVTPLFTAVEKARLHLALAQATTLDTPAQQALLALLEHDTPLPCQQLSLFGLTLHECLVFDLSDSGLLLYLPGDLASLRQFAQRDDLHDYLCTALLEPACRSQMLDYLAHEQHATFLDRLQQNLDDSGSAALDAQWPLRVGADLHLALTPIEDAPFTFLYRDHLARLKAAARQVLVPTADADEQARKRRREMWLNLGLDTLMVAGFFIPTVGTLMTAVVAYQLLDEAYEGYEAWRVGDRHLALRHLEAVGLNLALIGGLHVAGQLVPKLFNSTLMESLDAIALADGSQRLWRPDLAAYRSTVQLPEALEANALGQYLQGDKHYIQLDGHLYAQQFDEAGRGWRIGHPERPEAYQPRLEHNGDGAWRAEHERPRQWPLAKLLRRLGPRGAALDDLQLEQAARISGMGLERLRQLHLANAPTPPLLADTLLRVQTEARVQAELALEPTRQHDALFAHFYEGTQPPEANETRLREAFPALSSPLAQRLLSDLDVDELNNWHTTDTLPTRLAAAASQTCAALPLARALEGLYLPGLASTQSDRLILRALGRLPGWSTDWRLELRAGSPQGATLAAAGKPSASGLNVVIKSPQGYEAHLGDRPAPAQQDHDLCRAVFDALPATQRQALGLMGADVQALRQQLQRQVDADPARFLPSRLTQGTPGWGRKGGALWGGLPNERPVSEGFIEMHALRRRYRATFPTASDEEIQGQLDGWRQLGLTPTRQLQQMEQQLRDFHQSLGDWAGNSTRRQRAVAVLVNVWRRNAVHQLDEYSRGHALELADLGLDDQDLASLVLPDRFSHVALLDLGGNPALTRLPSELLARFPRLNRLYLRGCRLDRVPQVPAPAALERLDLEHNRITWDTQAQARLNEMTELTTLDLSGNPLIASPDLSQLRQLLSLRLSGCALSTWPTGLEQMESPLVLDLGDNQFAELPEPVPLSRDAALALRLESSGLGQRAQSQIGDYYQAHQVDLLVDDGDYDELLHNAGVDEWISWNSLPLQYRRDLRAIIETDAFDLDPQRVRSELWRRLSVIDNNPSLREEVLARPAAQLLALPL
ncbi:dermonecrotic toxin domain-containing protein [Pseudomonas sp. NPDC089554]|uniref:dermonecrotic toxin domain-containing protein n=1 Tax=Pseudomonas sp. NPDC089554 TaxID=3390653 RepID=UPI003D03598A